MAKTRAAYLNKDQFEELQAWLASNTKCLPGEVHSSLTALISLYIFLLESKSGYRDLVARLREAMGLTPKKEGYSKHKREGGAKSKAQEELDDDLEKYKRRRGGCAKKKKKRKRKKRSKKVCGNPGNQMLALPEESSFGGSCAVLTQEEKSHRVDKMANFENPVGVHTVKNRSSKLQVAISVTEQIHWVETATCPRTGKSVTACTDHVGPKRYKVTWSSISHFVVLSIVYGIPCNRICKMFSSVDEEIFSSTNILNYLKLAADIFEPVYKHLGETLAESGRLMGDDANTRVLDMEKSAQAGTHDAEPKGLVAKVAELFGRLSKKKNGDGYKKKINLSVISGKEDINDPRSYIFFFRTHFGSVGNLLTKLLEMRTPKNKRLTFLGDLSKANLPCAKNAKNFILKIAGCAAHARRPFWRYRYLDRNLCGYMLRGFLVLSNIEEKLKEDDASWDQVLRARKKYSRKVFESMHRVAKLTVEGKKGRPNSFIWPKGSELHKACAYIVDHYEELTRFIHDPHFPATNNLSERVLRPDKLLLVSAKFRKSEEGRVVIDILRTIVTTANAAEVNVKEYLDWVLMNHKKVEQSPQNYTPYAYAKLLDQNEALAANN